MDTEQPAQQPSLAEHIQRLAKQHNLASHTIDTRFILLNLRHRIVLSRDGSLNINESDYSQGPALQDDQPIPAPQAQAITAHFARYAKEAAEPATPKALPPAQRPDPTSNKRHWNHIVIHHSAMEKGDPGWYNSWHLGKNWDYGLGYHFLIGNGSGMPDGDIITSYRWHRQIHGAHAGVTEYNQHGIGICLVGNFDETHPSPKQLTALTTLLKQLCQAYDIPHDRIIGHSHVKATACPGKYLDVETLRKTLAPPPSSSPTP